MPLKQRHQILTAKRNNRPLDTYQQRRPCTNQICTPHLLLAEASMPSSPCCMKEAAGKKFHG